MARELIATEPAFYRGSLVERGQTFTFHGEKVPKWAVEKGVSLGAQKVEMHPDTKPEAARKAAKGKASGASDQVI